MVAFDGWGESSWVIYRLRVTRAYFLIKKIDSADGAKRKSLREGRAANRRQSYPESG
jgi:hypothetical protein